MLTLLLLLLQAPPAQVGQRIQAPPAFVAFAAELKITNPKRPDAYGRHLQDEHGCTRRETVYPDGAPMITITNFETGKMYRLGRGGWTVQPMRLGPMPRRPRTMPVIRKVAPIEGFDVWTSTIGVRNSPTGETSRDLLVIPALNFFEPVLRQPNGDTITAHDIRVGAIDHAEFLPPPTVAPTPVDEPGGFLSFQAVAVRITFSEQAAANLDTVEETPVPVRTPGSEHLQIVTTVVDAAKGRVRIRIMTNAKRPRPGVVTGDLLDELELALGQTGQTTKLPQNFSVAVTRIGMRKVQ
jgi:hypothetical protein